MIINTKSLAVLFAKTIFTWAVLNAKNVACYVKITFRNVYAVSENIIMNYGFDSPIKTDSEFLKIIQLS